MSWPRGGEGKFIFIKHVTRGLNGNRGGSFFFCWHYPGGYIPPGRRTKNTHYPHTAHIKMDKVYEQQYKRQKGEEKEEDEEQVEE